MSYTESISLSNRGGTIEKYCKSCKTNNYSNVNNKSCKIIDNTIVENYNDCNKYNTNNIYYNDSIQPRFLSYNNNTFTTNTIVENYNDFNKYNTNNIYYNDSIQPRFLSYNNNTFHYGVL